MTKVGNLADNVILAVNKETSEAIVGPNKVAEVTQPEVVEEVDVSLASATAVV